MKRDEPPASRRSFARSSACAAWLSIGAAACSTAAADQQRVSASTGAEASAGTTLASARPIALAVPAKHPASPAPSASAAPPIDPAEAEAAREAARDPAPLRPFTAWGADDDGVGPVARDKAARARRQATVDDLFAKAGVSFPASEVYFRVFKEQRRLEVWANDEPGAAMKPIATYGICMMSGTLGRKRHEGDRQVPEGFYEISFLKADSDYHLAMKVSYPNAFDRKNADGPPGGDIMVHGNCVSIGCVAMSDERIEELWTIVKPIYDAGRKVPIDVFPSRDLDARMSDPDYADEKPLWTLLSKAMHAFDERRVRPAVHFDAHAAYVLD